MAAFSSGYTPGRDHPAEPSRVAAMGRAEWSRWAEPSGRDGPSRVAAMGRAEWSRWAEPSGRDEPSRVAAMGRAEWPR